MPNSHRFTALFLGSVLFTCSAIRTAGQTASSEPSPFSTQASPGYTRAAPIALGSAPASNSAASGLLLMFPPNAATSREVFMTGNGFASTSAGPNGTAGNNSSRSGAIPRSPGGNIPGLVTVPTFAGAFAALGGPAAGRVFPYIMIGNDPLLGGKTEIPAKITAVSLNLLNVPSCCSASVPFSFEDLLTDSPNFAGADYTSGHHIQFGDAVQRAEFFNTMGENWHTILDPNIVNRVTIDIPRHVQVQLPDGSIITVQSYFVGHAPDGTEFIELLDLLFNALFFNQAVNDIIANNYTTDAFNMQAWPIPFCFRSTILGNPFPASCSASTPIFSIPPRRLNRVGFSPFPAGSLRDCLAPDSRMSPLSRMKLQKPSTTRLETLQCHVGSSPASRRLQKSAKETWKRAIPWRY